MNTKKLAKQVKGAVQTTEKPAIAKPRATRKVPEAAPQIKKAKITKVRIETIPEERTLQKRGRGRPKGSLGKKKRDAMLEAELARLAAA